MTCESDSAIYKETSFLQNIFHWLWIFILGVVYATTNIAPRSHQTTGVRT